MGIQLLSPWFLGGLAAAAIPIVIHLIHRRRAKILPIATLRFLRQIPARTIRKRRLEEYLLLAARVAVLALLALGAARPVLKTAAATGGATCAAVVLDDSYSMELRVGGISRFQEGMEGAIKVLRTLSDGDRAALLLASDPAGETLTRDLDALVRRVGAARPSKRAPDLEAAVLSALALLREAREPNRELVIVTDLQDRAVAPLNDLGFEDGDETIRVLLVDVGTPDAANLSVTAVDAGAGVVVAGETTRVTATVVNPSEVGVTTRVSLVLGDERVAERQVSLLPRQTQTVVFRVAADLPGAAAGRVFIDGDALLRDDERHFALPVMGRIPALLVNGDPSPVPYQDEAFFLRAALSPEELGAESASSPVNLRMVDIEELEGEKLDPYRVLILANVPSLSPRKATAVRAFVRAGGGLLFFGGNQVRVDDVNRDLGDLLPVTLSAPTQLTDDPEAVIPLERSDREHPLFADLSTEALRDLKRIHVSRVLGAEPTGEGSRVIASLEGGAPLIVERRVGRGRVIVVTTSADIDWGNLPLRPFFLPFLHRAMRLLAGGGDGASDFLVGATVEIPAPRPDAPPPEVTLPTGEVRRLAGEVMLGGGLSFGPLTETGVYRATGSGTGEPWLFTANVDGREGDLARASPDLLEGVFGAERFRRIDDVGALEATLVREREGKPLWGHLLGAALLLLLFEGFFANRIAQARAERERATEGRIA
ncbi:MAG: BatA domain-containing protein [Planctomycetota bacterium]